VTSRGNARANIFLGDDDRRRFCRQLRDNVETAAVLLYAYVLMDNHFHLLVRTPRANLSQFMQRLNTSYALYARYKHNKPGHLFEARFKAKLVQEEAYLLGLTRYIHLNPIKIASCRRLSAARRVERLERYPWSSYPGYVGQKNAEDFVCYDVLKHYAPTMAAARRQYRAYTHGHVMNDDRPILEAMKANRFAIGDEQFIELINRRLEGRRSGKAQDKDVAWPSLPVEIDVIDAHVAGHFGLQPADLAAHGHRSGNAKFVAVELACILSELNQRAIGTHYGGISSAAVSTIRRKIREGKYDVAATVQRLLSRIRKNETKRSKVNN